MSVIQTECSPCQGTGLFKGYFEKEHVAVVCHECGGTGFKNFSYIPFIERRPALENIRLVIKRDSGFVMEDADAYVTLEQWQENPTALDVIGTEPRQKVCPTLWFQMTNPDLKPKWPECPIGVPLYTCPKWNQKAECWEKFDRELL